MRKKTGLPSSISVPSYSPFEEIPAEDGICLPADNSGMTESAINKETPPMWCVTIDTAARCLRISTRRVRQLVEEGHAIRHGANRVDLAWLINLETGKGKWGRRPGRPDSLTLMALGWLVAHNFFRHEPEDVAPLLGIATRNHYSEEAARVALGVARALFPGHEPAPEYSE